MVFPLLEGFLQTYYYGSYWAFVHYDKIMKEAFLQLPQKPNVAIEVGCGDGMATYFLSKYVRHLISIDTDERCIEIVDRMIHGMDLKNVTLKKTDLNRLSLDKEADLIFFKDVLHHMDSPIDYLRSCLPLSKTILIVEANRYNPFLYFLCKKIDEEKLFLKRNSLRNILSIVEKAGWRCIKSSYIESAAYPIGWCYDRHVFHGKKIFKWIIRYLDRFYRYSFMSSMIDRTEFVIGKMFKPFCSEFIIVAERNASAINP